MFKSFWGSQEPQPPPGLQEVPAQSSWYPPSVVTSSNSSRPSTTSSSSSSSGLNVQRPSDRTQSSAQTPLSPAAATSTINQLKDKSVDELRRLLSDRDAYNQFLFSLDQVKIQKNGITWKRSHALWSLGIRIIRTTELAAAEEKLNELERQKEETLNIYSSSMLLQKLHDAMNKTDEESDVLHRQLLEKEIDMSSFL